jgi:hypothetical protein
MLAVMKVDNKLSLLSVTISKGLGGHVNLNRKLEWIGVE